MARMIFNPEGRHELPKTISVFKYKKYFKYSIALNIVLIGILIAMRSV